MELQEKILEKLNQQLNNELYAAYIYQAMGAQFEAEGLEGFASWMDAQTREELEHARKFYDYINERGGRVELEAIDKPPSDFGSPLEAFQKALEHEEMVTDKINQLVKLAREEDDYATESFLQWFVDEQVEEEESVNAIIDKLEMVGDSDSGIYLLSKELGRRE